MVDHGEQSVPSERADRYVEEELYLRSYPFASVVPVKVCTLCGAVVSNMPLHDKWHGRGWEVRT
jgi:hypothetical protein